MGLMVAENIHKNYHVGGSLSRRCYK
jgi:hypothetical protein